MADNRLPARLTFRGFVYGAVVLRPDGGRSLAGLLKSDDYVIVPQFRQHDDGSRTITEFSIVKKYASSYET